MENAINFLYASNFLYDLFYVLIIIGVFATALLYATREDFKPPRAILVVLLVGWFASIAVNNIAIGKLDERMGELISDYNLELASYEVEEDYIYALCEDSSSRYYDIYIFEEDGEYSVYTRNEKGVYLPVTSVSSAIIE